MEGGKLREDLIGPGAERSESPSPRKGGYNVQKDRLSPSLENVAGSDSDSSESSDPDSDNSECKDAGGKRGSYDLITTGDGDANQDKDDGKSCLSRLGYEGDTQRSDNSDAPGNVGENKALSNDGLEEESSDQDEFFDAITDIGNAEKTGENTEVILPDPSVAAAETSESECEAPPPPTTPLPVLQTIRPDIFTKYSLSQGWIERVNKSLVENSKSGETSWESATAGADSSEDGDFLEHFVGASSGRRKGHALLDQLKKSASDNRHDHIPRLKSHEPTRRLHPTKQAASDNQCIPASEDVPDELVTSDQDKSDISPDSGNGPCLESDDTAPPTTTKIRRAAYVSGPKNLATSKPGGVGYRLPVALRSRTNSYRRAVSQGRNSKSKEVRAKYTIHSKKDIPPTLNSGVRTSVQGALIPAWSSLPVFSTTDDTDPNVWTQASDGRVSFEPDCLSSKGDSPPSRELRVRFSNQNLPSVQQTHDQSHLGDPHELDKPQNLKKTSSSKKRNRKRISQARDVEEDSAINHDQMDNTDSDLDMARGSQSACNRISKDPSATESSSVVPVSDSDIIKTERTRRSEYELLMDAENDVMRVNISEPHGLTRKPAVRRKKLAYQSKVSIFFILFFFPCFLGLRNVDRFNFRVRFEMKIKCNVLMHRTIMPEKVI